MIRYTDIRTRSRSQQFLLQSFMFLLLMQHVELCAAEYLLKFLIETIEIYRTQKHFFHKYSSKTNQDECTDAKR